MKYENYKISALEISKREVEILSKYQFWESTLKPHSEKKNLSVLENLVFESCDWCNSGCSSCGGCGGGGGGCSGCNSCGGCE